MCGFMNPDSPSSPLQSPPSREMDGENGFGGAEHVDISLPKLVNARQSPSVVVFVVDQNLTPAAFRSLRSALGVILPQLPPESKVGFVTFSSFLAVYDLSQVRKAEAYLLSGTRSVSAKALKDVLGARFFSESKGKRSTVRDSGEALLEVLEILQHSTRRVDMPPKSVRAAGEEDESTGLTSSDDDDEEKRGEGIDESHFDDDQGARNSSTMSVLPRALGAALEAALHLASFLRNLGHKTEDVSSFAHIVMLSSGFVNFGPGTSEETSMQPSTETDPQEYLKGLCLSAVHSNTVISGCVGGDPNGTGATEMSKICNPTGGVVSVYEPIKSSTKIIDTNPSEFNVDPHVNPDFSSKSGSEFGWNPWRVKRDLKAILVTRVLGHSGSVVLRVNRWVRIKRVIGRVFDDVKNGDGNGGSTEMDEVQNQESTGVSTVKLSLGPLITEDAVSFYVCPPSDRRASRSREKENVVTVQTEVSYVANDGTRRYRISTRRWRIARDLSEYLGSMSVEATCILLAKKATLAATELEAEMEEGEDGISRGGNWNEYQKNMNELRFELDNKIGSICRRICDTYENKCEASRGVSKGFADEPNIWALPEHLRNFPKIMYYIRRGPLLGLSFQGSESCSLLRRRFQWMSPPSAFKTSMPTLFSFDSKGSFESLPASTLALQPRRMLVLDQYSMIIIWVGASVSTPEYRKLLDVCRAEAMKLAADRVPTPEILEILQGDSAERWLEARLSPGHKDSRQEQLYDFPSLNSEVGETERIAVCERLKNSTRDKSLREYVTSLLTTS